MFPRIAHDVRRGGQAGDTVDEEFGGACRRTVLGEDGFQCLQRIGIGMAVMQRCCGGVVLYASAMSPTVLPEAVDCSNAEHYRWGTVCDGWHLLKNDQLSVIQERVPPGAGEVRHRHSRAQQFFYVVSGVATLEFDDGAISLTAGQGLHVPADTTHRFANGSDADVVFLVISSPPTAGDRIEV